MVNGLITYLGSGIGISKSSLNHDNRDKKKVQNNLTTVTTNECILTTVTLKECSISLKSIKQDITAYNFDNR